MEQSHWSNKAWHGTTLVTIYLHSLKIRVKHTYSHDLNYLSNDIDISIMVE